MPADIRVDETSVRTVDAEEFEIQGHALFRNRSPNSRNHLFDFGLHRQGGNGLVGESVLYDQADPRVYFSADQTRSQSGVNPETLRIEGKGAEGKLILGGAGVTGSLLIHDENNDTVFSFDVEGGLELGGSGNKGANKFTGKNSESNSTYVEDWEDANLTIGGASTEGTIELEGPGGAVNVRLAGSGDAEVSNRIDVGTGSNPTISLVQDGTVNVGGKAAVTLGDGSTPASVSMLGQRTDDEAISLDEGGVAVSFDDSFTQRRTVDVVNEDINGGVFESTAVEAGTLRLKTRPSASGDFTSLDIDTEDGLDWENENGVTLAQLQTSRKAANRGERGQLVLNPDRQNRIDLDSATGRISVGTGPTPPNVADRSLTISNPNHSDGDIAWVTLDDERLAFQREASETGGDYEVFSFQRTSSGLDLLTLRGDYRIGREMPNGHEPFRWINADRTLQVVGPNYNDNPTDPSGFRFRADAGDGKVQALGEDFELTAGSTFEIGDGSTSLFSVTPTSSDVVTVDGNVVPKPQGSNHPRLGTSGNKWAELYVDEVEVKREMLPESSNGGYVGRSGHPWKEVHATTVSGNQVNAKSVTETSDRRLKDGIEDMDAGLAEILALDPVSFEWQDGDDDRQFGLVAQEVERVLPEVVSQPEDEDGLYGLEYGKLVSVLVNAISELTAERESLTERVDRQQDRLAEQRAAISELEGRFDELAAAVDDS